MTEDNLTTFLCECEKILNDRPLTPLSDDPNDDLPLTPNTILLLRENSCKSIGKFDDHSLYTKRYHAQAQYLADVFWKRFLNEYLPLLQERSKWLSQPPAKYNFKVGDFCLMTDEGIGRGDRGRW